MGYAPLTEGRLYFEQTGDGPWLLMLPGFGGGGKSSIGLTKAASSP